ncbi:transferrin-binding protein-like solute binding protein [Collimonas fungivorans]|nr:transferrin-binding protein-like solute binding protein [Collimonas fungivorans]
MHILHQKNIVSQLTNMAGLLLLGTLSACGGGGDNGNSTGSAGGSTTSPVVAPTAAALPFSRMGLDYQFSSLQYQSTASRNGRDLGATIDASANITFSHQTSGSQDFPLNYNFTFPSAFPGGSVAASNVFSTSNGAANKDVKILVPNATKTVQNVFWRNISDPNAGGFALPGYQTDLTTLTWPTSGTAIYAGKAFQYVIENSTVGTAINRFALYSSDVTATVDYAAQTIAIAVAANPVLIDSVNSPSTRDPATFASAITFSGINYSTLNTGYSIPKHSSGMGFSGDGYATVFRFFGANAEEFGGIFEYHSLPNTFPTTQYISMALRKQ